MLEFISENWIGSLIGIIGILTSIVISYYFYRKSQQKASPAYQEATMRIIDIKSGIDLDNIEIRYKGRAVNRLYKTQIVFWNDGNKTIDGKDILQKDKLRINFEKNDGELLSVNVVKKSRDINDFSALINPENQDEILIDFLFLDSKDGAVIEILHTYKKASSIIGTIKGIPQGVKNNGKLLDFTKLRKNKNKKDIVEYLFRSKFIFLLYVLVGLGLLYYGINYRKFPKQQPSEIINQISYIVMGVIFIIPITLMKILLPKQRYPKSLNIFEDE